MNDYTDMEMIKAVTSPKWKRARKRRQKQANNITPGDWNNGYDQGVRDALLIASVFALAIIIAIGALAALS